VDKAGDNKVLDRIHIGNVSKGIQRFDSLGVIRLPICLYVYKHALINAKIKPKYIENDGVSIQNG